MSYDLQLQDKDGNTFEMETGHEGGTMPIGGYFRTEFNITYNYGGFYYDTIDKEKGLRWLYGKTGAETKERLEEAIKKLGVDTTEDYWESTSGNAGYALVPLLEACKQYPDGEWFGD